MMSVTILSLLLLLPVLLNVSTSVPNNSFNNLSSVRKTVQFATISALVSSAIGISWLFYFEAEEFTIFSFRNLGLTVRIDALSMIMYAMISIIAFVVVRFTRNYLDGDPKHKQFYSKLAFTIAFVQLLVLSGNLATILIAWIGTSVGLHRLLLFYPERKKARLAAKKKFIVARLGDTSLLIAFTLIYLTFGSGDLGHIFAELQQMNINTVPLELEVAALFLALSASLKSVQVPFHGWLLNVMETPTPVSALLHAGLLNAGPFLIIRFAFLMGLASNASMFLIIIGAASALFGAVVSATQPVIKTSLAYSSIGHMGFSLMVSGFGVYSASLLHLVAHSFYKAHAFLSSGSIIEKVQTKNASEFVRQFNIWKIVLGTVVSIALYGLIAYFWEVNGSTEFQLLVIGCVIFFGVLSLQINALDSNNKIRSIVVLVLGAVVVVNLFFFLESAVHSILDSQIPSIASPSRALVLVSMSIILVFFLVVLIQLLPLGLRYQKMAHQVQVHLRNGLYFNQLFDKMTHSLNRTTNSNTYQ